MIYTSNLTVLGNISNIPAMYANVLQSSTNSNIQFQSHVDINGDVFTNGRMDVGKTIFATFRLSTNKSFAGSNEVASAGSNFVLDNTASDMTGMSGIPLAVPAYNIYNYNTGIITVPTSGFYYLNMQGSFSNSVPGASNGVYYKFLNHSHSNARRAAHISTTNLVSTSRLEFLLAGDLVQPTFYSSDANATLIGTNGETTIAFTVMMTVTPTNSNYYRT